jgi:1-acyl-sn-glycerol-3-phosphate acyltransferase
MSEAFESSAQLVPEPPAGARPDRASVGRERLSFWERTIIRFVRGSFRRGWVDELIRTLQQQLGSLWIHHCTKHLRRVYGLERLPKLERRQSYIVVSNHRSFFDMYVIIGDLVRRGMQHRIVFPVRSTFFYDNPLGLLVNGVMSFFAMYPPLFRERKKLILNPTSLDELSWLLKRGGMFCGIHPEGTRKKDDDPYTFLPAQRGVGRIIQGARVPVIPVFINGLINDLPRQIESNFDGSGTDVLVVYGRPIDFGDLLDEPATARTEQRIADRTLEAIAELGREEQRLRAALATTRT